jgi:hypothetical protein
MNQPSLKDLPVDLAELCTALEAEASEFRWYLDLASGAVLLLTSEFDPAEHDGMTAVDIEADPARFRRVPSGSMADALGDMHAFAEQHPDRTLKESLELALEAPRPDRRFRSALAWVKAEQDAWHAFRALRIEHRARAWLMSLGLRPAEREAAAAG